MISRKNYEIYFVDYFDGRLDEEAKKMLFDFLESNPDLRAEFERFENVQTKPETNIMFGNKESLKKNTPTLLNYKTWFIAELEGDLTREQISELDNFIRKNPSLEEERMRMQEIRFTAEDVSFKDKKSLRKPVVIPFRILNRRTVSIAAAIAIFILGYLFMFRPAKEEKIFVDDKNVNPVQENKTDVSDEKTKNFVDENKTVAESPVINTGGKKSKEKNVNPGSSKKNLKRETSREQLFTNKEKDPVPKANDSTKNITPVIITPDPAKDPVAVEPKKSKQVNPVTSGPDNLIGLRDVFDENDLKDLKENKSDNGTPVQDLALKEAERISGVSVKSSKTESSQTYALNVKKFFSISHTRANR